MSAMDGKDSRLEAPLFEERERERKQLIASSQGWLWTENNTSCIWTTVLFSNSSKTALNDGTRFLKTIRVGLTGFCPAQDREGGIRCARILLHYVLVVVEGGRVSFLFLRCCCSGERKRRDHISFSPGEEDSKTLLRDLLAASSFNPGNGAHTYYCIVCTSTYRLKKLPLASDLANLQMEWPTRVQLQLTHTHTV